MKDVQPRTAPDISDQLDGDLKIGLTLVTLLIILVTLLIRCEMELYSS